MDFAKMIWGTLLLIFNLALAAAGAITGVVYIFKGDPFGVLVGFLVYRTGSQGVHLIVLSDKTADA